VRVRWSGGRVGLALCYHAIGDRDGDPFNQLVAPLSLERFEEHLSYLARRYRVVRASELPDAVRSRRRGQRVPVAVTFDDDLRSHLTHAAPALRRAQLPATFFLGGTGLAGPSASWWQLLQVVSDRGLLRDPVLRTWGWTDMPNVTLRAVAGRMQLLPPDDRARRTEELRALIGSNAVCEGLTVDEIRMLAVGSEIGFHTRDHDPLVGLTPDALVRALTAGRAELEHVLGAPLKLIAYPHGLADTTVAAVAREQGYLVGFTGAQEAIHDADDRLLLPRRYPSRGAVVRFGFELARTLARRR
jgi:peptidoglycan/xylan/chitin deacetylase (PgdA/CDA1 family)